MTMTKTNILTTWVLALIMGVVLASCSTDNDLVVPEGELHAIAFASDIADEEQISRAGTGEATRATTLGHNFVVYGYKNVDGNEQTVFDGYTVHYANGSAHTSADNTHNYYYVEGEQSIKYWDLSATDYHFWGLWQETTDAATFSEAKHNVLTIHDVPLRAGDPAPTDNVLFSELYDRCPVSADVVQMRFKRPYAKMRIQFYTSLPMRGDDIIELTGIKFAPDSMAAAPLVNKVYGKGDVVVTYPTTSGSCDGNARETIVVENLEKAQDNLPFEDVMLTSTLGTASNNAVTAPIDESQGFVLDDMGGVSLLAPAVKGSTRAGEDTGKKYYYYPLPMGEKNPAFTMSVCIDGNSELKTAVVPATFMQWRANFFYTYIFKITEAGKKIEFDGVKIDPWTYGGSQEEEWRNW